MDVLNRNEQCRDEKKYEEKRERGSESEKLQIWIQGNGVREERPREATK
jgi:hypothetical protein